MTRLRYVALISICAFAGLILDPRSACAAPIRWWSQDSELSIARISDHTVLITVAPLDDQGKPRPGPPSSALVDQQPQFKLRLREAVDAERIALGKLSVTVKQTPLTVSIQGPGGKIVQELVFGESDGSATFRLAGPVLGLGEGDKQFDRAGAKYPLVNGQVAPWLATHGGTIRVPFLIGAEGWAMFVHRPLGEFDLRDGKGRFIPSKFAKDKGPLELYVIHVPEPTMALAEYIRLTGRPVMPPRWTLGYMQSHRTLADPQEPAQIAKAFRDKKLPCDTLIYLGTGYCPAGWNVGHGTLDFNPKTFDNPAENLKALHSLDFKVVLHINKAPRGMFGLSMTEKSESPLHISNYWPRHREAMALGVDGWWPDDGDELPIEARLARHRCYFEGCLQDRPNERPWSFHRNGYAGVQRYGGWIWSGDVQSRWATLAAHVPVGVNTSLSLTPFWGTDIGGFVPTKEFTGELYVRWFQFAAFNPLFRSHGRTWKLRLPWGWNTGDFGPVEAKSGPDPSELHNAQVEPVCRKYLELRYRLLPYNYTLFREACDTGLPPMRALWLHYPGDAEAVKLGDEYLWGRDFLVAPVVDKGATVRSVYLPAGNWYDWWTGEKVEGRRWLKRPVDLATMPLYVRAGAIVPVDPVRQFTGQAVDEPTTLQIYRGADGEFVLYEDDGRSLDYLKGAASWTRMTWHDAKRQLVIEKDARTKDKSPMKRVFDVLVLPDQTRKRVTFTGNTLVVDFEAPKKTSASEVTEIPDEVIKRYKLDATFYKKHLDYKGFSILSSAKVSDAALFEARYLIDKLLGEREDILQALIKAGCRFMVMAPTEMTTDVPEQRHWDKAYWDKRARGMGGKLASCGEENLLNLKGDRYRQENILIHEFNHAIHQQGLRSVDPTFQARLKRAYESAMAKELWKGTYVATNPSEYWAEGAQAYFDCMRPQFGANTREKLQKYYPELFALVDEVYKQSKFRYVRYDQRTK